MRDLPIVITEPDARVLRGLLSTRNATDHDQEHWLDLSAELDRALVLDSNLVPAHVRHDAQTYSRTRRHARNSTRNHIDPCLAGQRSTVLGPRSRATVVHAYEPPYQGMLSYAGVSEQDILAHGNSWRRSAAQDIRDLLRKESKAPERYDVWIGESHPAPAILRAVEMHRPDVLVLGTHARHRVGRALLGSVANHLLNLVDCDVLVVPKAAPVQH